MFTTRLPTVLESALLLAEHWSIVTKGDSLVGRGSTAALGGRPTVPALQEGVAQCLSPAVPAEAQQSGASQRPASQESCALRTRRLLSALLS